MKNQNNEKELERFSAEGVVRRTLTHDLSITSACSPVLIDTSFYSINVFCPIIRVEKEAVVHYFYVECSPFVSSSQLGAHPENV